MAEYIVGFESEQDVRLTLAAMEKKWWKWMWQQLPTQWNGWVRRIWDYTNFSLCFNDNFGQWCRGKNKADWETFINFKDAIKELTGSKSPVDATNTVEIPKYFFIKKDESNVLCGKYIEWLNKTYSVQWAWYGYNYYWYDGSIDSNGTEAYDNSGSFINNAKEITLEFWNQYMNVEKVLPVTATETTQSYEKPITTDAADPKADKKWRAVFWIGATDNIADAARYWTAVSYAGDRGRAGDVLFVDDAVLSGPYLAPKVPVKKSRYSSMLDLI